jgi:hypothetical protein
MTDRRTARKIKTGQFRNDGASPFLDWLNRAPGILAPDRVASRSAASEPAPSKIAGRTKETQT